jgi:methyltransferase (TIGR00027 family)
MPAAGMDDPDALRDISDTALWAAIHRARESERPDALFHDSFARTLAGERGERIAGAVGKADHREWPWAMRTLLFDAIIDQQVQVGADTVINLAAGLDARPYRMPLPAGLRWIEIDLPGMLEAKARTLDAHQPRCALERIALDLADVETRRRVFQQLLAASKRALILSEGLLIYLAPDEVQSLGHDLSQQPAFQRWAVDLCSPGLLAMLQRELGGQLEAADAPFKFGPAEGPLFFQRCGWKPALVHSLLKTAAKHRRVPWFLRMLAKLPDSSGKQGRRPWGGVCLLQRA